MKIQKCQPEIAKTLSRQAICTSSEDINHPLQAKCFKENKAHAYF